ncbi:MAG TPA: GDSL-type esterase/lipase family protein [Thermoanaerobaculia bacterium]|nr:GDSL-type esterase/lipase family protein [Thermoanaerobaculia bacterium]
MTTPLRAAVLSAILAASLAAYPASMPRTMHVALVGDSLAYGAGDEAGKGIAGRLEPELRSRGIESIVTTNLGSTGATTRDLAAVLRLRATRTAIARVDAIVLSAGANDLRAMLLGREPMRSPLIIADEVLRNMDAIVADIRSLNPNARILILGGYIPIADDRAPALLEPLVAIWDAALTAQFAGDPLVSIVRLSDIVNRPDRLSSIDSFHPGGEAYQETARRIADLLTVRMDR